MPEHISTIIPRVMDKIKKDWGPGFGDHHPYCKYTYNHSGSNGWDCICESLKFYDDWRKNNCSAK